MEYASYFDCRYAYTRRRSAGGTWLEQLSDMAAIGKRPSGASEHASGNIEITSGGKGSIWISGSSSGTYRPLMRNHGHRFCISNSNDVTGLDGAAELAW